MNRDFHPLTVLDTRDEIGGGGKTVVFAVPDHLETLFAWRAGQHLSLRFVIDGREERRSYSISAPPLSGKCLQITVKRLQGGLISNHINDAVNRGDVVDVLPPFGTFCLDAGANLRRTHYFFGAGSGITPLLSMLHSVLCSEPYSSAYLLYGNKNANSILFRRTLADLVVTHGDRLGVRHVLSAPSMWSGFDYWRKGIISKQAVEAFIAAHPPYAQDTHYYICGPGDMNRSVRAELTALDVPADRIHAESFGRDVWIDESVAGVEARARIHLGGKTRDIQISEGQTVLEAARAAGLDPPFSCQSAVCGACVANLKGGAVHMRARMALDDAEIAAGRVLTCQSVPTTGHLSIHFD